MRKKYLFLVQKFLNLGVLLLIILLPFFNLPTTSQDVQFSKEVLMVFGLGILIPVCVFKTVLEKKVKIVDSLVVNLIFLMLVFMGVGFVFSQTRSGSLFSVSAWAMAFGVLVFFIAGETTINKKTLMKVLLMVGVLVSGLNIIRYGELIVKGGLLSPLGMVGRQGSIPNLFGNSCGLAVFLTGCVIMGLWEGFKKQGLKVNLLFWVTGGAVCLAGFLVASPFTADFVEKAFGASFEKPVVLDLGSSWKIAVESFKYFPLTGYGPGLFEEAFHRFRPASFNLTPFWNLAFSRSGSLVLEMMTLYGGFTALIFSFIIAYLFYNIVKRGKYSSLTLFLLALGASFLFFPYLLVNWVLFFIILGVLGKERKKVLVEFKENTEIVGFGLLFLTAAGVIGVWYLTGRSFLADCNFKRYQELTAKNRVNEGYNKYLLKAIELNPYNIVYQVTASQANFATAQSLVSKKDLTDQEKAAVSQFLQAGVTIGKKTTERLPNNLNSWLNLATIYRGMVNVAEGASEWAIDSYQRAILISPNNPSVHFSLGGFFYGIGNYQQAVNYFTRAVSLKPDFANGFYNLSWSYRQQGMWKEAKATMERVLELVDKDGPDYKKAEEELKEIEKYISPQEGRKEPEKKTLTPTTEPEKERKEKVSLEKPKEATEEGIKKIKPTIEIGE